MLFRLPIEVLRTINRYLEYSRNELVVTDLEKVVSKQLRGHITNIPTKYPIILDWTNRNMMRYTRTLQCHNFNKITFIDSSIMKHLLIMDIPININDLSFALINTFNNAVSNTKFSSLKTCKIYSLQLFLLLYSLHFISELEIIQPVSKDELIFMFNGCMRLPNIKYLDITINSNYNEIGVLIKIIFPNLEHLRIITPYDDNYIDNIDQFSISTYYFSGITYMSYSWITAYDKSVDILSNVDLDLDSDQQLYDISNINFVDVTCDLYKYKLVDTDNVLQLYGNCENTRIRMKNIPETLRIMSAKNCNHQLPKNIKIIVCGNLATIGYNINIGMSFYIEQQQMKKLVYAGNHYVDCTKVQYIDQLELINNFGKYQIKFGKQINIKQLNIDIHSFKSLCMFRGIKTQITKVNINTDEGGFTPMDVRSLFTMNGGGDIFVGDLIIDGITFSTELFI